MFRVLPTTYGKSLIYHLALLCLVVALSYWCRGNLKDFRLSRPWDWALPMVSSQTRILMWVWLTIEYIMGQVFTVCFETLLLLPVSALKFLEAYSSSPGTVLKVSTCVQPHVLPWWRRSIRCFLPSAFSDPSTSYCDFLSPCFQDNHLLSTVLLEINFTKTQVSVPGLCGCAVSANPPHHSVRFVTVF